ncbi:MAG: TerC family protein [Candidatus Eremiobacterota bacterium]
MEAVTNPDNWVGLITLTVLEIVLGIDNIIFLSILSGRLPEEQQSSARKVGLALAVITRCMLLLSLAWVAHLTDPLFHIGPRAVSGRDLVLIIGGVFLLFKSTHEIHLKMEGEDEEGGSGSRKAASFWWTIVQILALDIVFSLDSVITAVGMVDEVGVMVLAVIIAVGIMMLAADAISDFVNAHPTVKMLALSFLLLIGMSLVAEGLGHHIPKPYIYFSMAFSAFVEFLNLRARNARKRRHQELPPAEEGPGLM